MSTGLNCEYIEVEPGKWYHILEHGSAPKQCWDWHEYATATGPFPTFDKAHEHLHRHNANPGGYCRMEYEEGMKISEATQRLIDEAESPTERRGGFGVMWL